MSKYDPYAPNGLAPTGGRTSVSAAESKTVGFFGRLVPQKGADVLLAAVAKVVATMPQVRFVFHGAGDMADALRAETETRGLTASVRFAGGYSQADVIGLMRQTDVVAVPSRWEGCPYVVLEAFQAGVPVVASAVGGIPDLIQDGVSGLCVAPGNPDALADALVTLLRDPHLRWQFAEQGRACVAEHTVEAMAQAVAEVYQSALNS